MHSVIGFLKGAVLRAPSPGIKGCYVVRENSIYAYDGAIQAGLEMQSEIEFAVPALELEAALARMKEVSELSYDGADLTVKGGRLRAKIHCDQSEAPTLPDMPSEWQPCPAEFVPSLKLALPFIGDRGWALGIRLRTGHVTALKNISAIDVSISGLELSEEVLLPSSAAEFLIGQGSPQEMTRVPGALFFRWEDGRWLRAQLLNDKMPTSIDQVFEKAGTDASVEITQEWKDALGDAAALSDGTIALTAAGFRSMRTGSTSEVDFFTSLSADHKSSWLVAELEKVFAVAQSWAPERYPEAACFVGPNLRGVVMGMAR